MMNFAVPDHIFSLNFMTLKVLSALYVLGIVISHATFSTSHIWWVAMVFSIAMNFTYPWAAARAGRFLTLEVGVSTVLIVMAILGVVASPLWVIASIFGHGVWDLFKHKGQGVPFLRWYTQGCVVVDWFYAAALLLFFLTQV